MLYFVKVEEIVVWKKLKSSLICVTVRLPDFGWQKTGLKALLVQDGTRLDTDL